MTGYPPVTGWSARNSTTSPGPGTCSAPRTRPSLGSSPSRARSSVRTGQPHPDPVRVGPDHEGRAGEGGPRLVGEPVPPGTRRDPDADEPRRRRRDRRHLDVGSPRTGGPDRQHVAGTQRRRPEPGQDVGRARAQHRGDGDPAPDGEVGEEPGLRCPEPQRVAGAERERRVVGRPRAPGAGEREDHVGVGRHLEPAEHDLDRRGVGVVAGEAVAERPRRPVGGTRRRHAERRPARPTPILDGRPRPRRDDGEPGHAPASTAWNRTRTPGRSSAGRSRSTSNRVRSVRPMSCHPPGELRG